MATRLPIGFIDLVKLRSTRRRMAAVAPARLVSLAHRNIALEHRLRPSSVKGDSFRLLKENSLPLFWFSANLAEYPGSEQS
jgi:hypothetical protein